MTEKKLIANLKNLTHIELGVFAYYANKTNLRTVLDFMNGKIKPKAKTIKDMIDGYPVFCEWLNNETDND